MKKRILAVLLSFCVAGGSILCPSEARAEEAGTQPASYMDAKGYAGLDAEFHTQEQIREYYNSHPVREMEGAVLTAGSYQYKVTGRKELAFTGYSGQPSSVIVPDTVKINGKSFKVTAIENRAFLNANIKSVSVGSALKEIGASAFQECRKLKKVTLGSGVTKIGKNAFSGCKKLTTIKIRSAKLKAVGKNAWKGISKSAKIKVPSKKLTAYKKLLKNKRQDKKVKIAKL